MSRPHEPNVYRFIAYVMKSSVNCLAFANISRVRYDFSADVRPSARSFFTSRQSMTYNKDPGPDLQNILG